MNNEIVKFVSGQHTVQNAENIPIDASQDSLNYATIDGKVQLVGGKIALGAEGTIGKITALHYGYKVDGTKIIYAKMGTALKYWDGTAWQNVLAAGLTENAEISFANYSSLAGAFTFVNGVDGYWKIVNSHPASPLSIYDSTKNFHGKIIIDKGRTFLWDRNDSSQKDATGLYGSWIDRQNATVYTPVAGEALGALGAVNYTGNLAFVAAKRNCFGVIIKANVAAGLETFTDNFMGVLTSNFGGTGTINYVTGAYNVTFSDTTTGAVTGDYQWENSNLKGVTDFTHTAVRLAGEGFQFLQDEGGDAIQNVLVGEDGSYFSMKTNSAYRLEIDGTDLIATNLVYRKDMGIPYWRCAFASDKGIVFINNANPTQPKMTILVKNTTDNTVVPLDIFKHFKFSNYDFSDASMSTFDRWILVFCKKSGSLNNDTILMGNIATMTMDVVGYGGRMAIKDGDNLYIGDSLTKSVYKIFNGFDDLGSVIQNYWIGRDELFGSELLKKERKLRFRGLIGINQTTGVYVSYDDTAFQLVGTITGNGSYVDVSDPRTIGGPLIGTVPIGGGISPLAYPYHLELKLKTPKFRKRTIKLIANNIGYFDFNYIMDWDILPFESRLPKVRRSKQNVSLDGTKTNISPVYPIDYYAESNVEAYLAMFIGNNQIVGQSFSNVLKRVLDSAKFYLKKTGAPAGNATATIYAHTGTYGNSGLPTGAVLATSNLFNVATLTGAPQLITFDFSGANRIQLSASTKYFLCLNYSGGNAGNYIQLGYDTTPTHGGNVATSNDGTTFVSDNAKDLSFYIYNV